LCRALVQRVVQAAHSLAMGCGASHGRVSHTDDPPVAPSRPSDEDLGRSASSEERLSTVGELRSNRKRVTPDGRLLYHVNQTGPVETGPVTSKELMKEQYRMGRRSSANRDSDLFSSMGSRVMGGFFSGLMRRSSLEVPFDRSRIGTYTRHGIAPVGDGVSEALGASKINQDRGVVCWPYNGSPSEALLCIFDGHGQHGEKLSELCVRRLPTTIINDGGLAADPGSALSRSFAAVDLACCEELPRSYMYNGTTATVVYARGDECWVAHCGDSRAVVGSQKGGKLTARELTHDHKPDDPVEMARIVATGAKVRRGYNGYSARVLPAAAVGGGLAMSRSIGDGLMKPCGVIATPDVHHEVLRPAAAEDDGDLLLIVASDGLWEFVSSQRACEIASETLSAQVACVQLVAEAQRCWKEEEGCYRDDITIIVVKLPFLQHSSAATYARRSSASVRRSSHGSSLDLGSSTRLDGHLASRRSSRLGSRRSSAESSREPSEQLINMSEPGVQQASLEEMGESSDGADMKKGQTFHDRRLSMSTMGGISEDSEVEHWKVLQTMNQFKGLSLGPDGCGFSVKVEPNS